MRWEPCPHGESCGMLQNMKSALGLLAAIALAALGLLSIVTFSVRMLAEGELVWLIGGWFAGPVTIIVWPAVSGLPWAGWFYGVLVVAGGIGIWAGIGDDRSPSYY